MLSMIYKRGLRSVETYGTMKHAASKVFSLL